MSKIILSEELVEALKTEIKECSLDLNIITGFCKLDTLKLINSVCSDNVNKKLLVRFLPSDLASGATDKEIYEFCKGTGWKMYVNHTVHAKTYIFDKIKCIVGSANLTNRGIGTSADHNIELSTYYELEETDYNKIISMYDHAEEMTDDLYQYIVSQSDDEVVLHSYFERTNKREKICCLLPEDFPDESTDLIELRKLNSYTWLKQYLSSKQSKEAYFGELSSQIHNLFVNEPKQYRKDIKIYLGHLFDSIKNNSDKTFKFEKPNYSEKIILI